MGIRAQHSRTNALSHGNTVGNTVCCGLYLKCSRAIHHCRCKEHAEKRIVPDLESREDNGHQSVHRCRIRCPFRFFLFLFAGSTGWQVERNVLDEFGGGEDTFEIWFEQVLWQSLRIWFTGTLCRGNTQSESFVLVMEIKIKSYQSSVQQL